MNWRGAVQLASVMALCLSASAQGTLTMTVQAPPPPDGMFVEVGGVLVGPPTGIKGQPYSLVEKTTQVRTLVDGTTITTRREQHRVRDSEGRVRVESGTVEDGQFELQTVSLMDPVARTMTTLFVNGKTAIVRHYPPLTPQAAPTPPTPEQQAHTAAMQARAEAYRKKPMPKFSSEDLQPETIAGLYATGRRHTIVIPAGRAGNDRDIHVVEDTWTSPDLKIMMRNTVDDPQSGKTTTEVTELERNEPDPALFQIPADYKVTERTP